MAKKNKNDFLIKKSAPREFDESSSSSSSLSQSSSTSSWSEFSSGSGTWTDIGGGDHNGENWIPSSRDVAGTHYNVGLFQVKPGVVLTVKSYDGANYGYFEVSANDVYMNHGATINADGAGYGGGGGGGGFPGGTGGAGIGGGTYGTGSTGPGGIGGGIGGGLGGNPGGGSGLPPFTGHIGGYASPGINGDTSTDQNILMGGGGGGGGGGGVGSQTYLTAGGGGAGGRGGGKILFWGDSSIVICGKIYAKGTNFGGDGSTPNGGSALVAGTGLGGGGSMQGGGEWCRWRWWWRHDICLSF